MSSSSNFQTLHSFEEIDAGYGGGEQKRNRQAGRVNEHQAARPRYALLLRGQKQDGA